MTPPDLAAMLDARETARLHYCATRDSLTATSKERDAARWAYMAAGDEYRAALIGAKKRSAAA